MNKESSADLAKINYLIQKTDFGDCRICHDKASGIHYGVATCEGCKGFFKRSIMRKRVYFCINNNQCNVTSENRKDCKSCRYKKCIEEGMSISAIKMGRKSQRDKRMIMKSNIEKNQATSDLIISFNNLNIFPEENLKGLHYLRLFCVENFKSQFIQSYKSIEPSAKIYELLNNDSKNFDFFETGLDVLNLNINIPKTYFTERFKDAEKQNFLAFLTVLRKKVYDSYIDFIIPIQKDMKRANYLIQNNITFSNREGLTKEEFMEPFLESVASDIKQCVSFSTKLPGFNKICVKDYNLIFKEYFYMMVLIRYNKLYYNGELYLMLKNNIQFTKDLAKIILGENAIKYILGVHDKLKNLNLTSQEKSLIYPFMLTSVDVPLKNPEYISMLNKYYSSALMFEFSLNNRDMGFIDKITGVLESFKQLKVFLNVPIPDI